MVTFQSSNLQASKLENHNLKNSRAFIFCSLSNETVGEREGGGGRMERDLIGLIIN